MRDATISGRNSRLQNTVLRNNTGITALFFNAVFLNISYTPSSAADMNASINHIYLNFIVCEIIYFFVFIDGFLVAIFLLF